MKVSEKTLNKLKIGLRVVHSNLNVSSYSSKGLSINVCPHCLLKSFEVNYSTLKDIEFSRDCRCYLKRLYGNNKC